MLIVLPRSSEGADAVARARARLEAAIEDPITVLALVGGDGPDSVRAVEVANARASVNPAIRRVVWIPDKSVLAASDLAKFFPGATITCFIGLSDKVSDKLTPTRATIRLFVDQAFNRAEGQR